MKQESLQSSPFTKNQIFIVTVYAKLCVISLLYTILVSLRNNPILEMKILKFREVR